MTVSPTAIGARAAGDHNDLNSTHFTARSPAGAVPQPRKAALRHATASAAAPSYPIAASIAVASDSSSSRSLSVSCTDNAIAPASH